MGSPRLKAAFFIFLVLSANAYRLQGNATAEDRGRGKARALSSSKQTTAYQLQQYSLNGGLANTQVTHNGYSSYAQSTVNTFAEECVPKMYEEGGLVTPPGIGQRVIELWPILLASAVVLMGGMYMYHRSRMDEGPVAAFCPVSSWQSDPSDLLIGSSAQEAYGEQLAAVLTNDNNRGMPKCHGLRRHRLRTDCDGDIDCRRQACRQMCCDRSDCTFFQFNSIDGTDNCWLGSRTRLSSSTCEQPWFGETCTTCRERRVGLWSQIFEDNNKCHSAFIGYTGFHVDNQYECQSHAVEMGHDFYQYDDARKKCETAETCSQPQTHTLHRWKIFSRRDTEAREPSNVQAPGDQDEWNFEPFLLHENSDMLRVTLSRSERCSQGDIQCMRDSCRAKCQEHDWCIHYQFEQNSNDCRLGHTHVVEEENVGMWFGGLLSNRRACPSSQMQCPSTHDCVDSCGTCQGHSRDGPDGWCVRSAVENMVDNGQWGETYQEQLTLVDVDVDAWCRGMERTSVTVTQPLENGQNGESVCKAACASDPQCAVWQMHQSDAERTDFRVGDHVRCWLGMEDFDGRPRFSCSGRSPKRWRLLRAPRAQAISHRGCTNGRVSCVLTNTCVENCQDSCPGFSLTNREAGLCDPGSDSAMVDDGVPMNVAIPANLGEADMNPDNAYLLEQGDILNMQLNIRQLINPDNFNGDVTAVCDTVSSMEGVAHCEYVAKSCVCEYDEAVTCEDLFGEMERAVPILGDEGMIVLSNEGCTCEGNHCTMNLMGTAPPAKTDLAALAAVKLGGDQAEECDATRVCPNMDTCAAKSYGAAGCGYDCSKDGDQYWCSNLCACNQVEASVCATGRVCPDMHSCSPISYGEYGCGYGCMKDSTYYFCSDDCSQCNV